MYIETNMEKRLNKKIETYVIKFKDETRNKLNELNFSDKDKLNELLEFIYEYERMVFSKDDLVKRKRIKNSIPVSNRCNARRANNEQCTRRRKDGSEYCGTHAKGTPNGFVQMNECGDCNKKIEVHAEDINGIVYYIDRFENVYRTEDIFIGKENPEIIAKYVKQNGTTTIKEFIQGKI